MASRADLLVAAGTLLAVALPHGVKLTALGLDEGAGSSRLWLGLPLLALGVPLSLPALKAAGWVPGLW